jgi:hypothetical protein
VLDGVRQRLGDDEVRRALDRGRQGSRLELDEGGDGHPVGQVLHRGRETSLHERGGHDGVHDLAQLGGCGVDPLAQLGGSLGHGTGGIRALRELLRLEREENQLHLEAVVQVLRDSAPLGVGGADEALAGELQGSTAGHELRGEPLPVQRDGQHPACGSDQLGLADDVRVVHDRSDAPAVEFDHFDSAPC